MSSDQDTSASATKSMALTSTRKNLDTITLEIRSMIIGHILADPRKPDFYDVNSNGKYLNYLAIWFVNKALSQTTDHIITVAKDLVVVSSNFKDLPCMLFHHGIPIVANHAIDKVKCHAMSLHIKLPLENASMAASSILMRKSDLEGLAKILRMLSLCQKHEQFSQPRDWSRLSMSICFQQFDGKDLPTKTKSSLLSLLKSASRIGKVTIAGPVDTSLSSILPGYVEVIAFQVGSVHQVRFLENSKKDREDYVTLGKWTSELASAAKEVGALDIAGFRYDSIRELCRHAAERNVHALASNSVIFAQLRKLMFRARSGIVECFLGLARPDLAWIEISRILRSAEVLTDEELVYMEELEEKCYKSKATMEIPGPWLMARAQKFGDMAF